MDVRIGIVSGNWDCSTLTIFVRRFLLRVLSKVRVDLWVRGRRTVLKLSGLGWSDKRKTPVCHGRRGVGTSGVL